jgi:hypothetical protein
MPYCQPQGRRLAARRGPPARRPPPHGHGPPRAKHNPRPPPAGAPAPCAAPRSRAARAARRALSWGASPGGGAPPVRESERSSLANEEVVLLIFQLELDAQLQRALNYEAYETAQEVRAKREIVGGRRTCSLQPAACSCSLLWASWRGRPRAAAGGRAGGAAQPLMERPAGRPSRRSPSTFCCPPHHLTPPGPQVDNAIAKMQRRKGASAGQAAAGSGGGGVADLAAEGLRLRSEMQRAAEEER